MWRTSEKPLLRQAFFGTARAANYGPPPDDVLKMLAREATANWLLNWRTLFWVAGDSSPLYALRALLSPLFSLRLFFEKGLVGDPLDLDGLLTAAHQHFPDETAFTEEISSIETPADAKSWFTRRLPALESNARALRRSIPVSPA